MKRFILTICMCGLMLLAAQGARAAAYSFTDSSDSASGAKGLLGMGEINGDSNETLDSITDIAGDPGATFTSTISGADAGGGTFGSILAGYAFTPGAVGGQGPPPTTNLSAFDTYEITIKNEETTKWVGVTAFMNTGFTDPNWDHSNVFHETPFVWIAPGAKATFSLDLTTLGTTDDSNLGNGDFSGLERRAFVSAIGFKYGINIGPTKEGEEGFWMPAGETLSVSVPEPASMALLALGGLALLPRRVRRQTSMTA